MIEGDMTGSKEPAWITYEQAIAIHSCQLRRFGGAPGLRDEGMLVSALDRPRNKWRYEQAALHELAAAYAFGLAKNHAFVDGNKRMAFMSMMIFLRKNGVRFAPEQAIATKMMIALAAGEVSEGSLARWIGDNLPKQKTKSKGGSRR
jgi:death-on-curing protein